MFADLLAMTCFTRCHVVLPVVIATLSLWAGTADAAVIITGIIDGPRTGGTPKAIELYVTEDIADLSVYSVQSYSNGGTTGSTAFTLSGSATAGDFIYIASESPNFTSYFGFAPTFTANVVNVNGDDAVALNLNSAIVDVFGVIGVDPDVDATWNYQDTWFYRTSGTSASSTFTLSDWFYATGQSDALDSLGTSGVNPASTDPLHMPVGSYVASAAAVPEPSRVVVLGFGLMALGLRRYRRA